MVPSKHHDKDGSNNRRRSSKYGEADFSSSEDDGQTDPLDSTTVSNPAEDDIKSISGSSGRESADFQPLTFNVNMTRKEAQARGASQQVPDTLLKVKEKLSKGNGKNHDSTLRNFLGSIDKDQFESYLKEPHYIKVEKKGKHFKQFRRLFLAQQMKSYEDEEEEKTGKTKSGAEQSARAIWVTKFSVDGKYMATGSKDGSVCVWKVIASPAERWELDFTQESRKAFKAKSLMVKQHLLGGSPNGSFRSDWKSNSGNEKPDTKVSGSSLYAPVFHTNPYKRFREHTSDILDMDWSKNNFLVTSSMDKSVRLWHPERLSSLKVFYHPDFVTCVLFHPSDDRFIITGCLDHKCRLWSILENEVTFEFDCRDLVTSITVSPGGEYTIVGTFNGYVIVLTTRGLEFVSSFHVTDKDTQVEHGVDLLGPQSKTHHGPRLTCLQCFKTTGYGALRVVVTSNDSRIRVFDLNSKKCLEVLRGFESGASQHRAQLTFWKNQPIVICGSDDHWVYSWKLQSSNSTDHTKETSKPHKRGGGLRKLISNSLHHDGENKSRQHNHGSLHLSDLLPRPHGGASYQPIKNNYSISFHAHHASVTTANLAPPETSKTLSMSNDLICDTSLEFYEETDTLDMIVRQKDDHSESDRDSTLNGTEPSRSTLANEHETVNMPGVVEAIGTIMVTTDTKGFIRVFRADMPRNIRERVLEKLREVKNGKLNSTDSLNSYSQASLAGQGATSRFNTVNLMCPTKSNTNQPPEDLQNACSTGRLRGGSVFRNPLFNYSNGSLSSAKTSRDFRRSSSISKNGPAPGLKCEECHGTNFTTLSNSAAATREAGYYCADCGTMLNNFR